MNTCPNCRGAIGEPGVAYGYPGRWCYCGVPRLATLTPQNTNSAEPTAKPSSNTSEQKHLVDLLPHQERVVKERDELLTKLEALAKFRLTDTYEQLPGEERYLFARQMDYMIGYEAVLKLRIDRFVRG